jgi:hypothetical protein
MSPFMARSASCRRQAAAWRGRVPERLTDGQCSRRPHLTCSARCVTATAVRSHTTGRPEQIALLFFAVSKLGAGSTKGGEGRRGREKAPFLCCHCGCR